MATRQRTSNARPDIEAMPRERVAEERAVRRGATPDWRSEVTLASGLNMLAGAWLIVSSWIVGYTSDDQRWNPIVFGAVILVLAAIRAGGAFRQSWISGLNLIIGGWLFASAFWLADSTGAAWNVAISGAVVFVLALWSVLASEDARRFESSRARGGGAYTAR